MTSPGSSDVRDALPAFAFKQPRFVRARKVLVIMTLGLMFQCCIVVVTPRGGIVINTKLNSTSAVPYMFRGEISSGILQSAAILCAVMGTDCPKIMKTDKGDANRILEELRGHFVPQRHVLFERYKFNSFAQKGETVDEFVVKLRQLAESCEFGTLKDSLIRDQLVIGTTDDVCRDRLLRERPVSNLNCCIECLRASELSRSHKQHISTLGKESIDYMHG